MTSATVAARVEPLECEGAPARSAIVTPEADIALAGGADRPETTGAVDPLTALGLRADREGAK